MTTTALASDTPPIDTSPPPTPQGVSPERGRAAPPPETLWRQILRSRRAVIGGGLLLAMVLLCFSTLPWSLPRYEAMDPGRVRHPPEWHLVGWFGYDNLGRSVLARCLLGGTISLAVGLAAATIAVVLGVLVGLIAGYRGGWVDATLMRVVDILYGLPYILLVILFKIAFEQPLMKLTWGNFLGLLLVFAMAVAIVWVFTQAPTSRVPSIIVAACLGVAALAAHFAFKSNLTGQSANLVVLFLAIGLVSWLTMARVIRGQVLSLRGQPFIEACRALGLRQGRIFTRHILPNLIGPITVYATLTVPSAILQESFLSFLGVGVNVPLATWGSLASEGVEQLSPLKFYWWQLIFPCALLALTLLSLNFLGDGLRDVFDPKKEAAKI